MKIRKLNLGCGSKWKEQYPGYDGLDIVDYGQKYVGDVRAVIEGMDSGIYDEVMANHFLEHFSQDDLRLIIPHVHRVLKDGGLFKVVVPHKRKESAWCLSHQTYWVEGTVRWLTTDSARDVYGFGSWKLQEIVTNRRGDIHAWLIKC